MRYLVLILFLASAYAQMPDHFTTERVRAEKICEEHLEDLFRLFSDPKVQKAYGVAPEEVSLENSLFQITLTKKHWDDYGCGCYAPFQKETDEFLGIAGLHRDIINTSNEIHCATYEDIETMQGTHELEIYYIYLSKHWRQGYGYEVASQLTKLGLIHLPDTSIIAYILPENIASHGLIRKMHFVEEGNVIFRQKEHVLYRLKKA